MSLKNRFRIKEVLITVAVAAGLLAAATLPVELGLNEVETREDLLTALNSGSVPIYGASAALKKVKPEVRATLVQGVLAWAKAYCETPEFAAAYQARRNGMMPAAPEVNGTVEEEVERQKAEMLQQIEEMKTMKATLPADQQPAMDDVIRGMLASVEQMYGDPEMRQMQMQGIEMQRAEEQRQYAEALEEWKQNYPQDPRRMIARRLREFLAVSAEVNFDAQLKQEGRLMRFVDAQYEQKPAEWKLCYRTGRETVAAAREFATAWLGALPQN